MKKSHIAVVILIMAIVIGAGYYMSNLLFGGDPLTWEAQVEYMDPISDTLSEPDEEIFNRNAINPTVDICIGGGSGGSLDCQGGEDQGGGDVNVDIDDGDGEEAGNGEVGI